jgi:NAD(P)-dependent dehydrogenase (short-subunit alcohol dehydrogenase family)
METDVSRTSIPTNDPVGCIRLLRPAGKRFRQASEQAQQGHGVFCNDAISTR